ncbi:hypothetical protein GCM10025880_31500 [Methylorubrum aminovorans]|uniref:hypothetical protein n=1 Tax=Methylorubrum aminovorans TaxID=269069 RepID=UPI0023E96BC3|nr:hypothetical protein [Methylorubrum aminovorans]GMA76733.1 hypothetical protein GCM10025880_31500 [Methylorubrum aminovorans]
MKPSSLTCHLVSGLAASALLVGAAAAQDAAPAAPPVASGKPANLCQELVAFVKQPEPANKAATTPPQQATAVSNPSGKTEGGKPSDGGEPQKTSGLSGAVSETGNGPAPGKQTNNPSANASGNPAVNPHAKANAEAKSPLPRQRPLRLRSPTRRPSRRSRPRPAPTTSPPAGRLPVRCEPPASSCRRRCSRSRRSI